MRKLIFITFLCLLIVSGTFAQGEDNPKSDQKLIQACGVEFSLPLSFKEANIKPFDSCIRQYQDKNIVLVLDVLGFIIPAETSSKDSYSNKKDFTIEEIKLEDRRAEIITFYDSDKQGLNYRTVLFVPVINSNYGHLEMRAFTKNAKQRDKVIKIFKSVHFFKQ